jgi:ribonuclease D
VAAGDRCVVLDCFAFDAWESLHAAVAGLDVNWIAHNAEFEQSWLARHGGFTLTPMFDTRWVFVRERARQTGVFAPQGSNLAYVCEELLGFELSKEERLSDWSTPVLSAAQVQYAALDSLVLIPLRKRLETDAIAGGWTAEVDAAAERSLAEALRFT